MEARLYAILVVTAMLMGFAAETAAGQDAEGPLPAVHAVEASRPPAPHSSPTATAVQVPGVLHVTEAGAPHEAPPLGPARSVRFVSTVRSLLYPETSIWPPALHEAGSAVRPEPDGAETGSTLLHDARDLARRLTSFRADRILVRVNPMKPSCTVYLNLSTQALLIVPLAATEECVDGEARP